MTPKGRPPSWAFKIEAPFEARMFYEMIMKAQDTPDLFKDCHVFTGSKINGIAVAKWEGKTTALPKIILGFLGMPYRKQKCFTPGCINPFHFTDMTEEDIIKIPRAKPDKIDDIPPTPTLTFEGYKETVEYYLSENELPLTSPYADIRALIPTEDISDEILKHVLGI